MPECKSCGAEIIWIGLPSGKKMPLNAAVTTVFHQISADDEGGPSWFWDSVDGHVTHFATCPNAAAHRKPKAPTL